MTGRNTNIYFSEATYNKLRQVAGDKISRFVSVAVEEKIAKTEFHQREELRQKLVADYQSIAQNKKVQEEIGI